MPSIAKLALLSHCLNGMKKFPLFFFHLPFFRSTRLVVETEEMQQPVDKKSSRLFVERYTVFFGLQQSLRDAYDDVSQRDRPAAPFMLIRRWGLIRQGERQYIGGLVHTSVTGIDAPHPFAVYEHYAEFSLRKTE